VSGAECCKVCASAVYGVREQLAGIGRRCMREHAEGRPG